MDKTVATQKKLPKLSNLFHRKPKVDQNGNPIYKKKKKLFKSRVNRSFGGDLAFILFLLIGGIFMGFPMIYAISNSFKPMNELWLYPPNLIVRNPTTANYRDLFNVMSNSLVPLSKYLFNTIFVTAVGTFFRVISASMCAYPISKRNFRGNKFIMEMIKAAMMFTTVAATLSNYIIMSALGFIDTFYALVIPALGSSMALYLVKNFMDQFPDSVLEAARIDGAGEFRTFWTIVMPNMKPAWMTLVVFAVQEYWNQGASVYIYREELKSLQYALSQVAADGIARAGVSAAIQIVMMIVPVATFLITQSNIIETMATSGMKD